MTLISKQIMFDWAEIVHIMTTQWSNMADVGMRWSIQSNIKHEQKNLSSEIINILDDAYASQSVILDWSGPNFLSGLRAVAIVLVQ